MTIRFWKPAAALLVVLTGAIGLAACSGTWRARAECKPGPPGPRATECSVSVEVSGTFLRGMKGAGQLAAAAGMSASQYTFDYAGSTVSLPTSGLVTVRLLDASRNTIAANTFAWARTGTVIYFQNPAAVDSWATPYADRAVSSQVSINSAPVSAVSGSNRLQVSARDNGVEMASAMTSFVCLYNCGRPPGPIDP